MRAVSRPKAPSSSSIAITAVASAIRPKSSGTRRRARMTVLMSPIHRSMSRNSPVQAAPVAIWPLTDFDPPTMSTVSADLNEPSPVPTGSPVNINSRTANRMTSASNQVAILADSITRPYPHWTCLHLLRNRERLVPFGLTRWSGLETLVCPEVLLGHFAHALLDERVHATRIRSIVIARKILPDRIAPQLVSGAARQRARHTGQHAGAGEPGHARKSGDGRGRGGEERHENRVARSVVLIGQVVKRNPLLQRGERRAHAFLAGNRALAPEARPPGKEQRVEERVLLSRVDPRHVDFAGQAGAARVQPDEVRREKDERLSLERADPLEPHNFHQPHHAFPPSPPQNRAFEGAPAEGAGVRSSKVETLLFCHLREAARKID